MLSFVTTAFDMKARIEEIPEFQDRCVVDLQTNLQADFAAKINRAKGLCVVINHEGSTNPRPKFNTSRFTNRFTVNVFGTKVLNADDALRLEKLASEVEEKLHAWTPASMPQNQTISLRVTGVDTPVFTTEEGQKMAVIQLTVEIV